jgi:hypothetical protein
MNKKPLFCERKTVPKGKIGVLAAEPKETGKKPKSPFKIKTK